MTGAGALRLASVNMQRVLSGYLPCLFAAGPARRLPRPVTGLLLTAGVPAFRIDELVLAPRLVTAANRWQPSVPVIAGTAEGDQ